MNQLVVVAAAVGAAVIGAVVVVGTGGPASSCTLVGCQDTLTFQLAEGVSGPNPVVRADGTALIDACNGTDRVQRPAQDDGALTVDPHQLNMTEHIDRLEIGYRPSCGEAPVIERTFTDISITYDTFRPNGPECPPECKTAEVDLR